MQVLDTICSRGWQRVSVGPIAVLVLVVGDFLKAYQEISLAGSYLVGALERGGI